MPRQKADPLPSNRARPPHTGPTFVVVYWSWLVWRSTAAGATIDHAARSLHNSQQPSKHAVPWEPSDGLNAGATSPLMDCGNVPGTLERGCRETGHAARNPEQF